MNESRQTFRPGDRVRVADDVRTVLFRGREGVVVAVKRRWSSRPGAMPARAEIRVNFGGHGDTFWTEDELEALGA